MGTKISQLKVTKVVDGDTIKVEINNKIESLRLICVDTEESNPGGSKPVTNAGKAASEMAKEYFKSSGDGLSNVDIEFDTDDPIEVCMTKHRGNYGRLLCYVHKGNENYNLKLIKEGWSPYFEKYGRSRVYHKQFTEAEAEAQAQNQVIWNPETNQGGEKRDYDTLIPWWAMRGMAVEDYRNTGIVKGVLSVRLDYQKILETMGTGQQVTVLCDLQGGINKWPGEGALIYAGSKNHKFNLWLPNIHNEEMLPILHLLEKRYAGYKRGYIYVSGNVVEYNNKPEIVITSLNQLSDFPPNE
jgi:micrococcal nuclease